MITNDEVGADIESSCSIAADERRVLCLAQDLIHCASHGRAKLPKHVGLAMSVRHMTQWMEEAGIHCQSNWTLLVL